jgi:hypothetical protein
MGRRDAGGVAALLAVVVGDTEAARRGHLLAAGLEAAQARQVAGRPACGSATSRTGVPREVAYVRPVPHPRRSDTARRWGVLPVPGTTVTAIAAARGVTWFCRWTARQLRRYRRAALPRRSHHAPPAGRGGMRRGPSQTSAGTTVGFTAEQRGITACRFSTSRRASGPRPLRGTAAVAVSPSFAAGGEWGRVRHGPLTYARLCH